jgi:myxalamid-type nonribosomal peptide synthetase MxaA
MSPVDYVSKTIVSLALGQVSHNQNFHVVNPQKTSFRALFQAITEFGYLLELMDYSTWRKRLIETTNAKQENALSAIIGHFTEDWPTTLRNLFYECSPLVKAACPHIDGRILVRYFAYFIQCGYLTPPPKAPTNVLAIDWSRIGAGVTLLTRTNRS